MNSTYTLTDDLPSFDVVNFVVVCRNEHITSEREEG